MKKVSKSSAKIKAWKAFSEYIRTKECLEYEHNFPLIGQCVTCKKVLEYNQLQAGHFIGGRTGGVLFVEDNVHAQCVGCNVFLRGNYDSYMIYMLDRYGEKRVRELADLKRASVKYTLQDYLNLIEEYKEKTRILMA